MLKLRKCAGKKKESVCRKGTNEIREKGWIVWGEGERGRGAQEITEQRVGKRSAGKVSSN